MNRYNVLFDGIAMTMNNIKSFLPKPPGTDRIKTEDPCPGTQRQHRNVAENSSTVKGGRLPVAKDMDLMPPAGQAIGCFVNNPAGPVPKIKILGQHRYLQIYSIAFIRPLCFIGSDNAYSFFFEPDRER